MSKSIQDTLIYALLISLPICYAQVKTDINDFKIVTWNTDGARWQKVQDYMNAGLDIMSLQEAGSLRTIDGLLDTLTINNPPASIGNADSYVDMGSLSAIDVTEYKWKHNNFYMYNYDTKLTNADPGTIAGTNKQSMAIISKQRADEVILFAPEVGYDSHDLMTEEQNAHGSTKRAFINRPVLGIRIANSVFLNIHTEPDDTDNEALLQIDKVQKFMKNEMPARTWLLMGDFNRTPQSLAIQADSGRYIKLVKSGTATHKRGRELDYGVAGGPSAKQRQIDAVRAALLPITNNPSDHKPVKFNF